jgi:BAG domain
VGEREDPSAASPTSKSGPSSLKVIQDIRSALAKVSSGFSFPPSLDFTDDEPDGLAFTPTNAPVRVYEHALDGLLAQLDSVESDGDDEVRVERRAAVKEVEKAIEDVARRVTEAREGAKQGRGVDAANSHETGQVVVLAEPSADGPFSSTSEDRVEPEFSSPGRQVEASSAQNSEVVLPHDMTPAVSEPILDEDILRVLRFQCSSPTLEAIPQADPVATPTVTPTDRGAVSSVRSDNSFASTQGGSADQETTDQPPSAPLESSASAAPLELYEEVSSAILASFSHETVSLSGGPEGEDDLESDLSSGDADDECEWIEVGEV